jgi:hypothetical protein
VKPGCLWYYRVATPRVVRQAALNLKRLMESVVTRQFRGRDLNAERMQETLGSALDDGRPHLVIVRYDGQLGIEFAPELGTWDAP